MKHKPWSVHFIRRHIQERMFLDSHLCPCSSMAVPLRPPMSHMMIEWSELPEKSTLCTGSQHSAVTLPGAKRKTRT